MQNGYKIYIEAMGQQFEVTKISSDTPQGHDEINSHLMSNPDEGVIDTFQGFIVVAKTEKR